MILSNSRFIWISNIECHEYTRVDIVQDQLTGKQFILKMIRKESSVHVHQFHKEVDTLSKIHHPFMPEIVDVFEEENSLCLVETYMKGISLKEWIHEHPIYFLLLKYRIILECFDLISYLHSLQILYIDFKFENLLIEKGQIYLIDFNGCIPYQSTQVLLASKDNISDEMYTYTKKEYAVDVYSIGKVFSTYFRYGLFPILFHKATQKESKNRYTTIQSMKKAFLSICIVHSIIVFVVVFLSVYLLSRTFIVENNALNTYLKNREDETLFMNAYTYTLNKQSGNQTERIQSTLYLWIENDWFDDSILNSNYATFLLRQAIQSQNDKYCIYFLENMDDETLKKNQSLVLFAQSLFESDSSISYNFIHSYLYDLYQNAYSYYDEIDSMDTLLTILLNHQIILEKEDLDMFFQIHQSFKDPCEKLEDVVSKYLEYNLFLENHRITIPSIPLYYAESFQDNEQIQLLIQYVRRAT